MWLLYFLQLTKSLPKLIHSLIQYRVKILSVNQIIDNEKEHSFHNHFHLIVIKLL